MSSKTSMLKVYWHFYFWFAVKNHKKQKKKLTDLIKKEYKNKMDNYSNKGLSTLTKNKRKIVVFYVV